MRPRRAPATRGSTVPGTPSKPGQQPPTKRRSASGSVIANLRKLGSPPAARAAVPSASLRRERDWRWRARQASALGNGNALSGRYIPSPRRGEGQGEGDRDSVRQPPLPNPLPEGRGGMRLVFSRGG